jgi:hypothetical protein
VAVLAGMMLAGLFGMMRGVNLMALRHVRMVTGLVVIAGFVMLCGRLVMLSCVVVVLSGFAVMFRGLF